MLHVLRLHKDLFDYHPACMLARLLEGSRGDFDETRKVEVETEDEDVSNLWSSFFVLSWTKRSWTIVLEALPSSAKENFAKLDFFARHTSS